MSLSGLPLLLGHKINHSALTIALLLVVLPFMGCDSLDPAIDAPSYISITSFDLATNYVEEGTDDHKITDAWVFVNDTSIGAYELPASIPVLGSGKQDIRIFPGIKVNGIGSTRDIYPFIADVSMSVDLIPGTTVNITPKVSYYPTVTFKWLEDFEIGSLLESHALSDTSLSRESVTSLPAMGSKSAVIRVDANRKVYFGATSGQQFTLPLGLPTYLELHYASNIELSVGAIKNTIQGPETLPAFLNLFPSNEWNKVYIDLTDYLKTHTDALSFEIYFFCSFNANVPNNRILLDNIKLIHQ